MEKKARKEDLLRFVQEQSAHDISKFDFFKPGDRIVVTYKIIEGDKERSQSFEGDVIQVRGKGLTKTFTIRKISNGVGVERIFPLNDPILMTIKNLKKGRVRRARLYYLRAAKGKAAVVREKRFLSKLEGDRKRQHRKLAWAWQEQAQYS